MSGRRFPSISMKGFAFALLVFGLAAFVGGESLVAAGRVEEAKKYTAVLKTSTDPKKVAEALTELGKLGQIMKSLVEDAVPEIEKRLSDKDPSIRREAAHAYGRCEPPADKAVPLLVKMVKDDADTGAKIGAIQGLAAMGESAKAALPTIVELAKGDNKLEITKKARDARVSINGGKKK